MGGPMRSGSAAVLDGSLVGGKVSNPEAVGQVLRQLLARTEVQETRALVALNDSIASFRVLDMAASASESEIEAAVGRDLPADPGRLQTRWAEVRNGSTRMAVYAVAYDRAQLKSGVEAVRMAGISAGVVELRSAALARTVKDESCVVLDLTSNPVEVVLIDRSLPRLWHSFELKGPYTEDVVAAMASPLISVLRYYRRNGAAQFGQDAPVLISGEQLLPQHLLGALSGLVGQPVEIMPAPARVPLDLRYTTYLGCLGLLMRRAS